MSVDGWLSSRANFVAAAILAVAFIIRLQASLGTFLNPDEALHFVLVNQATIGAAYRASLTNAHPPLYFFLLYIWRFFGDSEVMLRLPSVLAGTGAVWMTFQWIRLVIGDSAGFIALFLAGFCPPLIGLAGEVRGYSLLLLCLTSALYFLERALRDKSAAMIGWYSLSLYFAILTHYSALWFTIALGLYVLFRIRELPFRAAAAWALLQCGAAALYIFLYFTHIAKLRGSPMETYASTGWLQLLYFHPESQSFVAFATGATESLFGYLLSLTADAGVVAILSFAAGVVWIVSGARRKDAGVPWKFGLLLILPFALNAVAAIAGVYPYGGARHCVYLVPFAIAGISYPLAKAAIQKLWPVLLAAVLIVPAWTANAALAPQEMPPPVQRVEWMRDAITYLRQSVPTGGVVFADSQAASMLGYYLGRDLAGAPSRYCSGFRETRYGSLRVISDPNWSMPAGAFLGRLNEWRGACGPDVTSAWIFDGGWDENVLDGLRQIAPGLYSQDRQLGALSVFQLSLGPAVQ